ncbi:MAG: hypothetical protein F4Z24_05625 [Nitrospira sp. SB0666_bin_27]|nr:hypothetical protein [Nitrospira sp. SB0666_bin_27]
MNPNDSDCRTGVRYQPDETPPMALAVGLGMQLAVLSVAATVLVPAIIIRAGGGSESYLSWAVFAAVAVCGATTVLQAVRFGQIGSGYVLLMSISGASIAISITALARGGPALLATLVVVSSLVPLALSTRLWFLRRILTPTVTGTVIMLIPVTVMSHVFEMLKDIPDGVPAMAAPLSTLATLLVIAGCVLKGTGAWRLWAPVIGVVAGSAVAGVFGFYDVHRVAEASWIGLPQGTWPGLDLEFSTVFWTLLPAFVLVALIDTMQTISASIAIQHVSWRQPRAVDFRAVQGAVAAAGVAKLLSGLSGTVPNTTYSTTVSMTELTGVSARSVGIALGTVLILLAFLPKALAVILAIPGPVVAAYLAVFLAMLFVIGMNLVVRDGIDYRKGLICGVGFWVGVGFQNGMIFPEWVSEFAGGLLQNGMTAGGFVAIIMTLFMDLTTSRHRLESEFSVSALPKIREFILGFASQSGWDAEMANRLDAASEETLLTLLQRQGAGGTVEQRRLLLVACKEDGGAVLEFVASTGEENLQDRIALLGTRTNADLIEQEVSLRLLRHLASSVRHQQYHGTDIVTIRVEA